MAETQRAQADGPVTATSGGWRAHLPACALLLLAAFATRAVWFGDPVPDMDEQLYSLIGQQLLDGRLPYVDVWDRKPFGLFAIFAVAHALLGPGAMAYQIVAALFAAAGAMLVHALALRSVDRVTAAGAGLIYLPLLYAYGSFSGQSEVFLLPPMLAMLLLVRDLDQDHAERRAALAMLLGGLALQVKYTVAPQCLLLGLVALWHFRREGIARLAGRALAYAALGLAPTLLVAGYYALNGHFAEFWLANFTSIFERIPAPGGRFNKAFLVPLAPLAVLALGGVYAAFRLNPQPAGGPYRLYLAWAAAVLAGVFLPATLYVYYYAAFVPAAILLALPLLDRRGAMRWVPLAAVVAASALLLNLPRHLPDSQRGRAEAARLAAAIAPHVGKDGPCLFVFDGPVSLYRLTSSCLPHKVVYADHWNNALERDALGIDRVAELKAILARHPGAIVTGDDPVTQQDRDTTALVEQALASDYRRAVSAHIRDRTYYAWVRHEE